MMIRVPNLGLVGAVLGLLAGVVTPVRADVIGTPDNSSVFLTLNGGGGGNIPNALFEVTDYVGSSVSGSVSYTNVLAYGSGTLSGSVDHVGRTLRLSLSGQTQAPQIRPGVLVSNSHAGQAFIRDRIFIEGFLSPTDSVLVNAIMNIDGNITASGALGFDSFVDVNAVVNMGGSSFAQGCVSTRVLNNCTQQSGSFDVGLSAGRTVSALEPFFDVLWLLQVNASSVDGGHLADLSNTARINLQLPEGYSFRSESGFLSPGQPVPVPEPFSAAILAGGLGLFGVVRYMMRRRTALV